MQVVLVRMSHQPRAGSGWLTFGRIREASKRPNVMVDLQTKTHVKRGHNYHGFEGIMSQASSLVTFEGPPSEYNVTPRLSFRVG